MVSEQLCAFPISCMYAASGPTLRTGSHMVKKLHPFKQPKYSLSFKNPNTRPCPSQLNSFLAIKFDLLCINFNTICSSTGSSSDWCFAIKVSKLYHHLHASSMCDISHPHFYDYPHVWLRDKILRLL